jgi:hypothetical protein
MYTFINDPGHGWLRVPISDVTNSGFNPSKYSYWNDEDFFLEEDCDAPDFLEAIGEYRREFVDIYVDSFEAYMTENNIVRYDLEDVGIN